MKILKGVLFFLTLFFTTSFAIAEYTFSLVDGDCLATDNVLQKDKEYVLVQFGEDGQRVVKTKVLDVIKNDDECRFLHPSRKDVNKEAFKYFYKLSLEDNLNFGVAIPKLAATNIDSYSFSYCSTSEGFSFDVEDKKSKKIIWNGYYYIGIDIEPTCKEYK
ncbi:MAG: hypothetical protein ACK5LP_07800 [Campylobacteraceae bacterium]